MIDLSIIWFFIIGLAIFIYVIMDGFDLGIGILFPFFPNHDERDIMMNTVAPVWDGNETWMVLGGASLFAAFPLAYSTILSALYIPFILMVTALIFRGVAFEFRFKASRSRHLWDLAFILGSILTSFTQGVILGAYIQGIQTTNGIFSGKSFDWLTPFSIFTGIGVLTMYATLGCGWLILKTNQQLQQKMFKLMPKLIFFIVIIFFGVSLYTPLIHADILERWFALPNIFYLSPIPIFVLIFVYLILKACKRQEDIKPFIYSLILVLLAFIGFGISMWPNLIPPSVTIWQAASPFSSQLFTLIGTLFLIPIIITYTIFAYWVFREKVTSNDQNYH